MKIFIINLESSQDRRRLIERQLAKYNLDYEFFSAVDGRQMSGDEIKKYLSPNYSYPRELKKGEIGCYLSHYFVLKHIVENKIQKAVVLEDDVILSADFSKVLNDVEVNLGLDNAILLYTILLNSIQLNGNRQIRDGYTICEVDDVRALFGTQGYAIGISAAERMVNNLLPINNVIDDWLWYVNHKYIEKLEIIFPFPIKPTPAFSDIHDADLSKVRFGWIKKLIRKYKVFPLWQVMMYKRKKDIDNNGVNLITFNNKKVTSKYK